MMKKVMNTYYVHKSNRWELFKLPFFTEQAKRIVNGLDGFLDYQIIKYDWFNHKLSLIKSPDWDTANEPIVGNTYVFDLSQGNDLSDTPKKIIKGRTNNPQIYHNKWMFVADDYNGFDIEKAKERTKLWNSIPNISEHKCRIGNQNYWFELLDSNRIER